MVKSSPQQAIKKLTSAAMDSHTKIVPPVKSFTLKASSDFASRSVNVFNSLSTLENNHQTWMSHNETLESFEDDNTFEPIRSTPDVFKKPFAPLASKRRAVSSHNKRNRKKWIKYSLEDIPLTSDAANSAVAFQFMRELCKRKEAETAVSSSDDKLIFCKPKNDSKRNRGNASLCSTSAIEESSDKDTECSDSVSGQKGKCVASSVKLMHLEDEFDDA